MLQLLNTTVVGSSRGSLALYKNLGAGNFGVVYEASCTDGTKWAVKVLKPGDPDGPHEVVWISLRI